MGGERRNVRHVARDIKQDMPLTNATKSSQPPRIAIALSIARQQPTSSFKNCLHLQFQCDRTKYLSRSQFLINSAAATPQNGDSQSHLGRPWLVDSARSCCLMCSDTEDPSALQSAEDVPRSAIPGNCKSCSRYFPNLCPQVISTT